MPKGVPLDLVGQRFGQWLVLSRTSTNGAVLWQCACACGTEKLVQTSNLRSGRSTGCRPCGARRSWANRLNGTDKKETEK